MLVARLAGALVILASACTSAYSGEATDADGGANAAGGDGGSDADVCTKPFAFEPFATAAASITSIVADGPVWVTTATTLARFDAGSATPIELLSNLGSARGLSLTGKHVVFIENVASSSGSLTRVERTAAAPATKVKLRSYLQSSTTTTSSGKVIYGLPQALAITDEDVIEGPGNLPIVEANGTTPTAFHASGPVVGAIMTVKGSSQRVVLTAAVGIGTMPTVIADGTTAVDVVTDARELFWIDGNEIKRAPVGVLNAPSTTIATDLANPRRLYLDGDLVYVATASGVARMNRDGTCRATAPTTASSLAIGPDAVYAAVGAEVLRAAK